MARDGIWIDGGPVALGKADPYTINKSCVAIEPNKKRVQ